MVPVCPLRTSHNINDPAGSVLKLSSPARRSAILPLPAAFPIGPKPQATTPYTRRLFASPSKPLFTSYPLSLVRRRPSYTLDDCPPDLSRLRQMTTAKLEQISSRAPEEMCSAERYANSDYSKGKRESQDRSEQRVRRVPGSARFDPLLVAPRGNRRAAPFSWIFDEWFTSPFPLR